jgi:hypothetical protein
LVVVEGFAKKVDDYPGRRLHVPVAEVMIYVLWESVWLLGSVVQLYGSNCIHLTKRQPGPVLLLLRSKVLIPAKGMLFAVEVFEAPGMRTGVCPSRMVRGKEVVAYGLDRSMGSVIPEGQRPC